MVLHAGVAAATPWLHRFEEERFHPLTRILRVDGYFDGCQATLQQLALFAPYHGAAQEGDLR